MHIFRSHNIKDLNELLLFQKRILMFGLNIK